MRLSSPWVACAIVFVASFCTLVIELIAGRIMAPYIGVSLYTWTSIIGVVLAGISLGNYVGGRIADRAASPFTLGILFLLSGLASLAILVTTYWVMNANLGQSLGLVVRIVLYTIVIFFAAPCVHESSYYCIRISSATLDGVPVRSLVLDHLVHSYVALDNPTFIGYGYERVYNEVTEWHLQDKKQFSSLFIGGGGYTFPKY